MDLDASWCPVCDRQIQPKRFQVPVAPPPPPPTPAPPPSSPQSSPTAVAATRKTKGALRQRGGLVQGTGRLKPNGTIKRSDSTKSQQAQTQPPAPLPKMRTVIDQGPTPLYCSDECKLADINNAVGLPINYNPEREGSHPTSPVPRERKFSTETESDYSSDAPSPPLPHQQPAYLTPSIAKFAAHYNFPPPPPPAPIAEDDSAPSRPPLEYNSGVMMAGKLIAAMCPPPPKRSASYNGCRASPEPRKPVPGWTDGSNAWRSSVYSLSAPKNGHLPLTPEDSATAYQGFTASPHRSKGVHSTVGEASNAPTPTPASPRSTHSLPPNTRDLMEQFSRSLSRRTESRAAMYPSSSPLSTHAFPATAPVQRRERSLVKPGAEGKLLVPEVKMKVRTISSASLSSNWSGPLSSRTASSRRSLRSPLSPGAASQFSQESSETQQSDSYMSLPGLRRPTVESRSWSYDNLKTYPIMQLPPKKEKRMEKQIINGEEVEVEVEVIIEEPRKRLFLFPATTRLVPP